MIDEAVAWVPPMDVYEIDDNYIVNAELPGIEAGDVKMDFSSSEFTLRGERPFDADCEKESYDRLELRRGRFQRTFSLPEPIDTKRVRWELRDGVLHAVIPKSGKSRTR